MSDFKEIINYLKIFRDSSLSKTQLVTKVDYDFNEDTFFEEELIPINKKELENNPISYYKLSGNEHDIDINTLYLKSLNNGSIVYYKKIEFSENNNLVTKFKRVPDYLSDELEDIDENQLFAIKISSTTGYYYDKTIEIIIYANKLDEVTVSKDFFAISYSPNDLILTNGSHVIDESDLENNKAFSVGEYIGNKELIDRDINIFNYKKREVDFLKSSKAGLMNLFPTLNNLSLQYAFYEKGIPSNSLYNKKFNEKNAIILTFKTPLILLEYLNHTIFYEFDNLDQFSSGVKADFLKSYNVYIESLIRNSRNNFLDTLQILYFVPAYLLKLTGFTMSWDLLDRLIKVGFVTEDRNAKKESYLIHILEGLYESYEDKSLFMMQLLHMINEKTRLEHLHYRIDTENNVKLIKFLFKAWKQTRFIEPSIEKNSEFKTTNGPIFLPYESQKWAGFYFSNTNVSFVKQEIKVAFETGRLEDVEVSNPKFARGKGKVKKEIIKNYNYHPFHPIYINNIEKQETTIAFESIIPAFLLYVNENKAWWNNFVKTGEYIIDGITIASGFASLKAAKHFAHIARLAETAEGVTAANKVAQASNILKNIKNAAGVVEISSGSTNLMLKLTELDETEFGQSLSKVLFYLELITLAGELTVPLKANLKKSAREAIENTDSIVRAKNAELFFELYKITNLVSKGGKVKYGESILSTYAIAYRKTLGKAGKHDGNITVFAYVDKNGSTQFKEFTTFGSQKDWKAAGFKEKPHAEAIGNKWLETNNIPRENISMVYSELNFCHFEGHLCNEMIHSNFPKAIKEYSYEYPGKLGDNLQNVRDKSINDRKFDLDKYIDNVEIDSNKYFNK